MMLRVLRFLLRTFLPVYCCGTVYALEQPEQANEMGESGLDACDWISLSCLS
jgi:hypothetical protein